MPDRSAGVCALVLAAGQGRRFRARRNQDKLLVPLAVQGVVRPVLGHVLYALAGVAEHTRVLVRADHQPLRSWLAERFPQDAFEHYPVAPGGLGDSLAGGATIQPARGFLLALGDMPWVRRETYAAIAAAIEPDRLVVPLYQGRAGHPRGIGVSYRGQLLACRGDRGAAELFATGRVLAIDVNDPGVLADIDCPEDLQGNLPRGTFAESGQSYP